MHNREINLVRSENVCSCIFAHDIFWFKFDSFQSFSEVKDVLGYPTPLTGLTGFFMQFWSCLRKKEIDAWENLRWTILLKSSTKRIHWAPELCIDGTREDGRVEFNLIEFHCFKEYNLTVNRNLLARKFYYNRPDWHVGRIKIAIKILKTYFNAAEFIITRFISSTPRNNTLFDHNLVTPEYHTAIDMSCNRNAL